MSTHPYAATDPAQLLRILKGTPAPEADTSELEELRAKVERLEAENALIAPLQAENKRLKRDNTRFQMENGAMVHLIENKHLKPNEKIALVRLGRLTLEKKEKVGTDPNGNVRISPSEIANDWRKKDTTEQYNADGSHIVMARKTVPPLLEGLRHIARLDYVNVSAGRDPVSGRPYMDDLLLEPPASLHDFLKPFAWYQPAEQVNRKTRTTKPTRTPCPHCGKVHDYDVTTTCTGCKQVVAQRTIDRTTPPAEADAEAREPMVDKLSPNSTKGPMVDKLSPPPQDPGDTPDPWDMPRQTPPKRSAPSPAQAQSGEPWLTRGTYMMRNGAFERVGDAGGAS
jgi:hypothetical protein